MNTFAVLLLAFPFYLAVNGKLADYIALAKPDASSNSGAPAATTGTASASSPVSSSDMSNVVSIFKNVGTLAELA